NYGGGYGGYGGYAAPSYAAPVNPGLGMPYNPGVIGGPGMVSPYISPIGGGINSPAYYPPTGINGGYGGYGAGISPISQPGFSSPVISSPIYSDPGFNSPFYP
ncbi:MAG: hypothetical protein K8R88_01325, partial [Armatimonadetes bacterium]|nr:hypothetical protein [Armatimonadota bacterium]